MTDLCHNLCRLFERFFYSIALVFWANVHLNYSLPYLHSDTIQKEDQQRHQLTVQQTCQCLCFWKKNLTFTVYLLVVYRWGRDETFAPEMGRAETYAISSAAPHQVLLSDKLHFTDQTHLRLSSYLLLSVVSSIPPDLLFPAIHFASIVTSFFPINCIHFFFFPSSHWCLLRLKLRGEQRKQPTTDTPFVADAKSAHMGPTLIRLWRSISTRGLRSMD